jgi:hypothetical protein
MNSKRRSTTQGPSTGPVAVTGYNLYLDGAKIGNSTTTSYTFTGLTCGATHSLSVSAFDGAGYTSPQAGISAQTSACPPAVSITAQPASPTAVTTATFGFVATNATGTACQLDGGGFTSCTSPTSYQGLAPGAHKVTVMASNASGSAQASDTWTVLSPSAVALPIPPQDYSLPAGAVYVSTSQQLVSALGSHTTQDIALADGTYTTTGTNSPTPDFQVTNGDRLWAAHRRYAILQAGLTFGGNYGTSGGEVHGLTFNISNPALTENSAAVYSWGPDGVGTKVYDTTFEGNYALDSGVDFYQVQGTVIQRVVVRDFLAYGVHVSDNSTTHNSTAEAGTITDVDVNGVRETTAGSSNGTAEFGVWIGNGVANPVQRLRSEHGWWGGLWTGASSHDTIFSDITISTVDVPGGVAVYNEHNTVRDTFENFNLGPYIGIGFNCEWNYSGGYGACQYSTFQNGTIASKKTGVFLDQGQVGNTVQGVTFLNQTCAAIVDDQGTGNTYTNNDYTGIAPGAVILAGYC